MWFIFKVITRLYNYNYEIYFALKCIDKIYIGDEKYDINQLLNIYQIQNYKFKAECYFLYENKNTLHIKLIFKNNNPYTLEYEISGYEHEYDLLIHELEIVVVIIL